jgi:hypothetical protein
VKKKVVIIIYARYYLKNFLPKTLYQRLLSYYREKARLLSYYRKEARLLSYCKEVRLLGHYKRQIRPPRPRS